jgi:hypothetical protein
MLHACATRFNMTRNLKIFWKLNKTKDNILNRNERIQYAFLKSSCGLFWSTQLSLVEALLLDYTSFSLKYLLILANYTLRYKNISNYNAFRRNYTLRFIEYLKFNNRISHLTCALTMCGREMLCYL